MTAKEYLSQARRLKAIIHSRHRKLEYWKQMEGAVSGSQFEAHYNPNRANEAPFVRCVTKIDEVERGLADLIEELACLVKDIEDRLDTLDDREEHLLLRYRYLEGYSWEKISVLMSVSLRTVHRIHASALQKFPAPD